MSCLLLHRILHIAHAVKDVLRLNNIKVIFLLVVYDRLILPKALLRLANAHLIHLHALHVLIYEEIDLLVYLLFYFIWQNLRLRNASRRVRVVI